MSDLLPVVQKAQPDLLEELASLEHDQWCEWTERLSQFENITQERLVRWNALRVPYDELPERQKEQDRVYARRVLAIIERLEWEGYEKREQTLKNKIKELAIEFESWRTTNDSNLGFSFGVFLKQHSEELLGLSKQ